jgi:hypothetical protein
MSKKFVEHHVRKDQYFKMLAMSLGMIKKTLNYEPLVKFNVKYLRKMERELLFLQEKYRIVKRS